MSKFVKIRTELRDLDLVRRALDDLKLAYEADATWVHAFSKVREPAALVVKAPGAHFGLRAVEDRFEVLADDMQTARIKPLLAQLMQRYAYHKVLADAALAGFDLVEEQTGADKVIRLTVRRWSQGQ